MEMDATGRGRGVVLEEPPPAYYTLDHRNPHMNPLPRPVEMGVESRRGGKRRVERGWRRGMEERWLRR